MNTAAHSDKRLYLAIEFGSKEWKLAFGTGSGERETSIVAGDLAGLDRQIARGKERLGLPADAKVRSCYEAGRDGFWIHRMLTERGVENVVVDPASIEVKRRGKRVKTDRLDAKKLRAMLIRYWVYGETKSWSVVKVPTENQEDARRAHRERGRLSKERTAHRARIRSLLALHGPVPRRLVSEGAQARDWKGRPLPPALIEEIDRELERLARVEEQLGHLEEERRERYRTGTGRAAQQARQLSRAKGVGEMTATLFAHEFFWRDFKNRREVGAAAGLVGCPYDSGQSRREQGISKAGNRRIRTAMIELAWRWLTFQPDSELSRWYERRFAHGSGRLRRIGIVALARKLLVALWKFLEYDQIPAGAIVRP